MTICIATDSYPPHQSGIATHNGYLAKRLQENGYTVLVLTADFDHRNEEDSIQVQDGITVVVLRKSYGAQYDYYKQFIKSGTREAVVWMSLGAAMRNWLFKNQARYSIRLLEVSDYGGFGLFLIDKQLPPVVLMCHGMLTQLEQHEFHNQDENSKIIRFLETNLVQHADTVICHSKSNASEISNSFQITAEYATAPWINETIIPEPVVHNEFIIASRLQVCKGALVMAGVMESLVVEHPGIRIHWVGEDTYTAPEGWKVSKYLRKKFPAIWQKTFLWSKAVPRSTMMQLINKSAAVLIPSTWETFNYVALEAGNRKKALVLTRQAGIASLLDEQSGALLADATDAGSIKNALIRIHEDKPFAESLGQQFYNTIEMQFNKGHFLSDREKAYQQAISRRASHLPLNPILPFFN